LKPVSVSSAATPSVLWRVVSVVFLLVVFLIGVKGLGDGFKMLGKDLLDAFFSATENPFISLMVGVLATTLVQSSSVSTSMVVALVAAPDNPLPIANAIPMIMGANIGTTVTNTVVSLAHMGRRDEFQRAFAVATCHDFFNFMTVAVLLPMELMTGYLQKTATLLASLLGNVGGVEYESPVKGLLKLGLKPIKGLGHALFEDGRAQGVLLILVSGVLIYAALFMLVRVMRSIVQTRMEVFITRFLGMNVFLSIAIGIIATVMVQSSSITTSLLVPLAGAGLVTLQQAFPITVGANIGTTITALLASLASSGANARAGIVIALVHLLFNLSGALLIYVPPPIRKIPMALARALGKLGSERRVLAVVYILAFFYGLPVLLLFLSGALG
jgi:sodium-dependent phosphate cotransporter